MPVFTAIGAALGASTAAAFGAGVGATALGVGIGTAAFAAGGGFDSSSDGVDGRVSAAASEGTGGITDAEASSAAKKRAFRSGVLFTSPTGLDSDPKTSSAKLR